MISNLRISIILLVFIIDYSAVGNILPSCPKDLEKWCICEESTIGFYVRCSKIPIDLNTIVNKMETLRIAQLTITQVDWPEIKLLPKSQIRSVHLVDCGIRSVEPNAFANFAEQLEELNLSNNSINVIPQFGLLPKLTTLDLNYNQISQVAENSFNNTPAMKILKLRGNRICNLSRIALNETKDKMESLDLSKNCFDRVPAQNLRNSMNLQHLDLSGNRIVEIANFELMNLPQLKELRMERNNLERIAQMAFMNVPKLEYLYLHNNLLSNIESPRLFQVFKQLKILNLSYNHLSKIPVLKELPNIREIRIDFNKVEKVDTLTFSTNPKLQLISLQSNNIAFLSRNSFDSLERLSVLLLNNNSLVSIDRGMLDGIKNLQQLNMKNNSLKTIGDRSFSSVPLLTMLDLSNNELENLSDTIFDSLKRLFWLDLSNNRLVSFKKGTFKNRIAHLILHGNRLICDDSIDWLMDYLVSKHVRTFLPFQPDIVCSTAGKNAGIRLKELMIKKANDTVNAQNNQTQQALQNQNLLYNLLPSGLINGLQNVPDQMKSFYKTSSDSLPNEYGTETPASQIGAALRTMPNTVVNVPGLGNFDISKLPPNLIDHVLRGGQIPGVPKETLNQLIAVYAKKLKSVAGAKDGGSIHSSGDLQEYSEKTETIAINSLSATNATEETYDLSNSILKNEENESETNQLTNMIRISPQLLHLIKLLPPNYDITKIPSEVMQAVSRNELPDFGLLPADLQQHLITNIQSVVTTFVDKQNITIDEILKKLPKFDRPAVPTFAPYSIDDVRNDLIHNKNKMEKQRRIQFYTGVLLSLVGAISTVVLVMLCIYMKRKRRAELENGMEEDSLVNTLHLPPTKLAASLQIQSCNKLPHYSNTKQNCTINNFSRQPRPST